MKKTLFIIAVILLVLLGILLFLSGDDASVPPPGGGFAFPTSTDITPTYTGDDTVVRTRLGSVVDVRDFRNDQYVEQISSGDYIIRNTNSPSTAAYEILYSTSDRGIIIALMEEPLGFTRLIAEKDLIEKLGVSETEMCTLAISVAVPGNVDFDLAGRDLGLSFCPGSTRLDY